MISGSWWKTRPWMRYWWSCRNVWLISSVMRFSGAVAIHIQPNTLYTGNLQPSVTAFHGTRAVRTTPDRFTSFPPAYAESSELNTDRHKWGTCCTKKYSGPETRSTWGGGEGTKKQGKEYWLALLHGYFDNLLTSNEISILFPLSILSCVLPFCCVCCLFCHFISSPPKVGVIFPTSPFVIDTTTVYFFNTMTTLLIIEIGSALSTSQQEWIV